MTESRTSEDVEGGVANKNVFILQALESTHKLVKLAKLPNEGGMVPVSGISNIILPKNQTRNKI